MDFEFAVRNSRAGESSVISRAQTQFSDSLRLRPLPIPLTPLVGRDLIVAQANSILERNAHRLITLTGPGGVGKTRLALRIGADQLVPLDDRVGFVPLSGLDDSTLILSQISQALGVREHSNATIFDTVTLAISDRKLLLILDNVEHLLDGVLQISRLLGVCPSLTILVTSRAPLRIAGEKVISVRPLSVETLDEPMSEASRLFVERAKAANPDFHVDDANVSQINEICCQLDGLPLAIELAVARLSVLTVDALLDRISIHLDLLTSNTADSPARHQGLRNAITWSYELLGRDEQSLFCALSAVPGGISIETAEVFSRELGVDPFVTFSSIVDQSLLMPISAGHSSAQDRSRFVMLSTIRDFAQEQLDLLGLRARAEKVAAHCALDLVARLDRELKESRRSSAGWLDTIDLERNSIEFALRYFERESDIESLCQMAALLSDYWFDRGLLSDGRRWLEVAIPRSVQMGNTLLTAQLVVSCGLIAMEQGEFHRASELLVQAIDLVGDDPPAMAGWANFGLGVVAQDEGRPADAKVFFESAMELFLRAEEKQFANIARNNLGLVTARAGDSQQGLELIGEARQLHLEAGFAYGAALADRYQGQILFDLHRYDEAMESLTRSLRIPTNQVQGWHVASSLEWLARVFQHAVMWRPRFAFLVAGSRSRAHRSSH